MNYIKRGADLEVFKSALKTDYDIRRTDNDMIDIIVDLSNNKGFVRGNDDMEMVYTFKKGKLSHISPIIK